jgi:hypothetical protein
VERPKAAYRLSHIARQSGHRRFSFKPTTVPFIRRFHLFALFRHGSGSFLVPLQNRRPHDAQLAISFPATHIPVIVKLWESPRQSRGFTQ